MPFCGSIYVTIPEVRSVVFILNSCYSRDEEPDVAGQSRNLMAWLAEQRGTGHEKEFIYGRSS